MIILRTPSVLAPGWIRSLDGVKQDDQRLVARAEVSLGVARSPNLLSFATSCVALNQGPFPPPALPGFSGTAGLSATPSRSACPSRASDWSSRLPRDGVSRVAPIFLLYACCRHYPGGTAGPLVARCALPWQSSPICGRVGFRGYLFEACSAFTHVTACILARSLS